MAAPPQVTSQYLVFTSYNGPDNSGVIQTWVLPPTYVYAGPSPGTPLGLPYLWTGTGSSTAISYANDDFVLGNRASGSPTPASVVATLQLTGKNAWNTGASSRTALRQNFLAFVAGIESTLEQASPALLVPGATALIASALVQFMPLPLAEVLLYNVGLETGIGTGAPAAIDVVPGMRLRSEPSARQYVAPPTQSFSGYVSTGSMAWVMTTNVSTGTTVQAFDPFLGTIAAPSVVPPPTPPVPLYGLVDLQQTGGTYKYYRLTYPQNVIAGSSPGSASVANAVQLTAANTLATLRSSPAYTASFFGRDIVVPEIPIFVQFGQAASPVEMFVPIGTTVANVLERYTRWLPLAVAQRVLVLARLAPPPPNQGTQGAQQYTNVVFAQPNGLVNDLRAFALPLVAGDRLTITLGSS